MFSKGASEGALSVWMGEEAGERKGEERRKKRDSRNEDLTLNMG